MTTAARTSPPDTSPVHASPLRRVLSAVCLGVPALAVLAFGGQLLVTGWLDSRAGGSSHVHDLAWGSAEGLLLFLALAASLRKAERRPAALLQALAVVAALLATMVLTASPDPATLALGALVVTGALLSPARPLLLRRTAPVSRPLLVLALAAFAALVPYALDAAAAQRAGGSPNAELNGYVGATLWALALPAVATVAAMRPAGWRLPASSAAVAAAVMGTAGILWPAIPSSPGILGGIAALAWAGAVLAVVLASKKDDGRRSAAGDAGAGIRVRSTRRSRPPMNEA